VRKPLAAAIAAAFLMAGCMGDDDSEGVSALVKRDATRAAGIPITGASPAQRRVLRSILAGMGRTRIEGIELSEATGRWPDGDLVLFRVPRDDLRAEWDSHLVGGVFRDRSLTERLPTVAVVAAAHGASNVARANPDSSFRPFRAEDANAVLAGVEHAARKSGAELERVELLQPEGLAVAARLQVSKPARFLSERWQTLVHELDADTARYEGRYLEIVDGRGRPVLEEFGVSRLHWGGGGPADRRYAGCVFIGISPPMSYDPPPCPVER
jgi:hypothetical protein